MTKKVKFADLIAIPRKQRSTKVRQKTFTTHLLLSDENLAKIHDADKQAKKKKKKKIQRKRENALKIVLADEKRKRNVQSERTL